MPSLNHIHTLRRVKHKTRKDIFMCTNPECSFTRNREFLVGKHGVCPYCHTTFILDRVQLNNKEPHCGNCKKGNARLNIKEEKKFIKDLLSDKGLG